MHTQKRSVGTYLQEPDDMLERKHDQESHFPSQSNSQVISQPVNERNEIRFIGVHAKW